MEAFLAKKKGHLQAALRRELLANPCYMEERYSAYCQNVGDRDGAIEGDIPTGGFRRPAALSCSKLMDNADNCVAFWKEIAQMNIDDGKSWHYDGMQLRSNLPPLADRDALYEQMGGSHYTKFFKLPTGVKNFDKFTMKFNETH